MDGPHSPTSTSIRASTFPPITAQLTFSLNRTKRHSLLRQEKMAAAEGAVAPAVAEERKRKKAAPKEKKKPAKGKDQKASHPPYFQVWPWRDHPSFCSLRFNFEAPIGLGLLFFWLKLFSLSLN